MNPCHLFLREANNDDDDTADVEDVDHAVRREVCQLVYL